MKIAIIGSRTIKDKEWLEEQMNRFKGCYDNEFISGGAVGVDSFIENWCKEWKKPIKVIRPINSKDKFSYLLRNVEIITLSDEIFAFWDGESKGTKFVIDYAKARGKKIEVVKI